MAVYFIQAGDGGPVKIGISSDPWARMRKMQSDHDKKLVLIRLFEGGLVEEGVLHHRFSEHRLGGEWFAPAKEIIAGDIGLTPLPVERVRKPRQGTGWTEESYRKFNEALAARMQDPAYVSRRAAATAKTGARIGTTSSLIVAAKAMVILEEGVAPVWAARRARRDLRDALHKLQRYHAAFPSLIEDARAEAATKPMAHVAKRLVDAVKQFAALTGIPASELRPDLAAAFLQTEPAQ